MAAFRRSSASVTGRSPPQVRHPDVALVLVHNQVDAASVHAEPLALESRIVDRNQESGRTTCQWHGPDSLSAVPVDRRQVEGAAVHREALRTGLERQATAGGDV